MERICLFSFYITIFWYNLIIYLKWFCTFILSCWNLPWYRNCFIYLYICSGWYECTHQYIVVSYQSHCPARGWGCLHLLSWWSLLLCSGSGWTAGPHLYHCVKNTKKDIRVGYNDVNWITPPYQRQKQESHHTDKLILFNTVHEETKWDQ